MNDKIIPITFLFLDRQKGIKEPLSTEDDEYPLPTWYRSVRDIPIDKLGVENISKACRQQIHIEYILPIALDYLASEPLACELYDGELLVSLKNIPADYWRKHPDHAKSVKFAIDQVISRQEVFGDVLKQIGELLEKLAA